MMNSQLAFFLIVLTGLESGKMLGLGDSFLGLSMKRLFLQITGFCGAVWRNFIQDGCLYRASALTFTSLLALVPLMVVGFTVLGAIPEFRRYGQVIQNFIGVFSVYL